MIIDFFKMKNAEHRKEAYRTDKEKLRQERPVTMLYYDQIEAINVQWAVISNLRAYASDEARNLELLCLQNAQLYTFIVNDSRSKKQEEPHHAPCYVRLCMLYEKQKRYEDAITICKQAIEAGAYEDGSSGKMYGRLARLIRKAAAQIPDDQVISQQ